MLVRVVPRLMLNGGASFSQRAFIIALEPDSQVAAFQAAPLEECAVQAWAPLAEAGYGEVADELVDAGIVDVDGTDHAGIFLCKMPRLMRSVTRETASLKHREGPLPAVAAPKAFPIFWWSAGLLGTPLKPESGVGFSGRGASNPLGLEAAQLKAVGLDVAD